MNDGHADAPPVGFRRHFRAEASGGNEVYLFSEHDVKTLRGPHIEALADLLDGRHPLDDVLRSAPDGATPEQVAVLLDQLAEQDLVTVRSPAPEGVDERALAYWDAGGIDPAAAVDGVARARVRLIPAGAVDLAAASEAFRAAGLSVLSDGGPGADHADLSVVLCDDYLHPDLAGIDARLRRTGTPWLPAKPVGTTVWLGPVFQPSVPGCWHCLAIRLRRHRNAEACALRALGREGPARYPIASVPPLAGTALSLVALEAAQWLAGYRYPGQRAVWTFDSLDRGGRHHSFRPYPQCPSCGNPELMREQAARPVRLRSRAKAHRGDAGHRSLGPDEVWERYQELVSPVTGIVKQIERDGRGPALFNSFRAGANVALAARNLRNLRALLRCENGGKGVTETQAKVSALGEAIERYSATFHGDEQRVPASLRSLGDQAVDPRLCLLFHERQFPGRAAWNAAHSPFSFVCEPFDENRTMDWTQVWSLTTQRFRYLPTELLYLGAPATAGRRMVLADSNGNAAGSSREDAVLQGMLELVERDAVALWWYNRTRAPGVDLDAFGDPWTDELRAAYTALGRSVWVLDVTSDFGIPVMVAVSAREGGKPENVMLGFGAHLDPRVAVRRALTELNQLMPAILDADVTGRYSCEDPDALRWWREATVAGQPYLAPDPAHAPRRPADYRYQPAPDLLDDVSEVRARLASRGLEVLVLDQTRPDIGLPVVKVVVPGLRPFWARFAPGRLYDVPVRLGRLSAPTRYQDLNPYPLFL